MHIICDSHEEAEGEEGRYFSFLFHSCNSPLYYNPRSKIWTFKHKARSVSGGRQITSYLLLPDNYYILSIVVKFISSAVLPHRFTQPIIQPQVSPAISINLRVISDGVGMENIFIMLHHQKELYIDWSVWCVNIVGWLTDCKIRVIPLICSDKTHLCSVGPQIIKQSVDQLFSQSVKHSPKY